MEIWLAANGDMIKVGQARPYLSFEGVQGVWVLRVSALGEKN